MSTADTITTQLKSSSSLLSIVDSLRNWRAAVVLLMSFVLAALIFMFGGWATMKVGFVLGLFFWLIGIAVAFYGVNAAGLMIWDDSQHASGNIAESSPSKGIMDAILVSLSTSHRLLGVMLLVLAVYIVGALALALILFICKIPYLGALLLSVVFPVAVVVTGLALFALYVVVMPLAAPAIWSGATTMQALARLAGIARKRLVNVVLMMLIVAFIAGFVAMIVFGIMMMGTLMAGGMTASIIGVGPGMGSLLGGAMMGGMGQPGMGEMENLGRMGRMMSGGTGHMTAAMIGGTVVWAIAFVTPALVYVRGCCDVYRMSSDGMDFAADEAKLREGMDAAKRKAEAMKEQAQAAARERAERAQSAAASTPEPSTMSAPVASPAPSVAPATPVAVAMAAGAAATATVATHCPKCQSAITPEDLFCGNCGHKLK
jgi:signal transduction histidine kinase